MPRKIIPYTWSGFVFILIFPLAVQSQFIEEIYTPSSIQYGLINGKQTLGKTAGMGYLEFTVKDTLNDLFNNPSIYRSNQNRFFASPYIRLLNVNSRYDHYPVDERYNIKNHAYFFPLGGVFKAGKFHFGGYLGYANYYFRKNYSYSYNTSTRTYERKNSHQEALSGVPLYLITGMKLNSIWSLGLSFNHAKLSYSRYGSFDVDRTFKNMYRMDDQVKLGIQSETDRHEFAVVYTLFQNIFNMNKWVSEHHVIRIQGIMGQFEYHYSLTDNFTLSSRFAINYREQKRAYKYPFTDNFVKNQGNIITKQFSLGFEHDFNNLLLGAELEYEPSDYSGSYLSTYVAKKWNIRSGIEIPISNSLKGQLGFAHSLYRFDLSLPVAILSSSFFNISGMEEPAQKMHLTRLTGGITYHMKNIRLSYHVNYTNYPSELDQNKLTGNNLLNNYLNEPFVNQFTIQYLF